MRPEQDIVDIFDCVKAPARPQFPRWRFGVVGGVDPASRSIGAVTSLRPESSAEIDPVSEAARIQAAHTVRRSRRK